MTTDHCPGSQTRPCSLKIRPDRVMAASYGVCGYCRRDYYVRSDGLLHVHKGLPRRADGGCPYACGPSCDFACYAPKEAV